MANQPPPSGVNGWGCHGASVLASPTFVATNRVNDGQARRVYLSIDDREAPRPLRCGGRRRDGKIGGERQQARRGPSPVAEEHHCSALFILQRGDCEQRIQR